MEYRAPQGYKIGWFVNCQTHNSFCSFFIFRFPLFSFVSSDATVSISRIQTHSRTLLVQLANSYSIAATSKHNHLSQYTLTKMLVPQSLRLLVGCQTHIPGLTLSGRICGWKGPCYSQVGLMSGLVLLLLMLSCSPTPHQP